MSNLTDRLRSFSCFKRFYEPQKSTVDHTQCKVSPTMIIRRKETIVESCRFVVDDDETQVYKTSVFAFRRRKIIIQKNIVTKITRRTSNEKVWINRDYGVITR